MKQRIFHHLENVFVTLLIIALGIGAWSLWYEKPWLSYGNLPFQLTQKSFAVGQPVTYWVERCNDTDEPRSYIIARSIINQDTQSSVVLPSVVATILPGCSRDISSITVIPEGTPPGKYKAKGSGVIKGTVRDFNVIWYSETFEVTQ